MYDDADFLKMITERGYADYIQYRYFNITSRLILETALVNMVRFPIVWRLMDSGMMMLTLVCLSKLTSLKKSMPVNWLLVIGIAMIPTRLYQSAGWIATTLNYSWTMATCLVAMVALKKIVKKQSFRWYEYPVYLLCTLYAVNMEPTCGVILGAYSVTGVYLWLAEKRTHPWIVVTLVLTIASLAFIFTCPGNGARTVRETANRMPELVHLNFLRKAEMGFSSTLYKYFMEVNFLFLWFVGVVFIGVVLARRHILLRGIAAVPLVISLVFGLFGNFFEKYYPLVKVVRSSLKAYGTGLSLRHPMTWIPDLILAAGLCCLLISLWVVFSNKRLGAYSLLVFLLGFATRFIMGFSPTIWASGVRTHFFMYIAFVLITALIYHHVLQPFRDHTAVSVWRNCALVIAVLTLLNVPYVWQA